MKKRFWLSAIAACTLSLTAAAGNSAAMYNSTIKHLDQGGEALFYQNTAGLQKLFTQTIPKIIETATKNMPDDPQKSAVINGANSLIKLINIAAIKATGASSKEVAPGIYDFKGFTLVDRKQKSILLPPTVPSKKLNISKLPADTVLAFNINCNIAHLWNMVYQEAKNNPDQMIKMLASQVEAMAQSGIDINRMLNSINGTLEITVTASAKDNYSATVIIPDKNGSISAFMRQQLPPELPTPVGNVTVTYLPGKIKAFLRSAAYTPATGKLGSLPEFKRLSSFVPATGNGFGVLCISGNLLNIIRQELANSNAELNAFIADCQPTVAVITGSSMPDGEVLRIISTFSIPQLQQSGAFFAPYAAILLPALNSARDRARQTVCFSNLKQFATGCLMFANDNKDMLPSDMGKLKSYIDEKITGSIIFLLPNVNISKLTTPGQIPLAICDRSDHTDKQVHVVFADGHVQYFNIQPDDDEEDIVNMLIKQNNLPQNIADILLKSVSDSE